MRASVARRDRHRCRPPRRRRHRHRGGQLLVTLRATMHAEGADPAEVKAAGDGRSHDFIVQALAGTIPTTRCCRRRAPTTRPALGVARMDRRPARRHARAGRRSIRATPRAAPGSSTPSSDRTASSGCDSASACTMKSWERPSPAALTSAGSAPAACMVARGGSRAAGPPRWRWRRRRGGRQRWRSRRATLALIRSGVGRGELFAAGDAG